MARKSKKLAALQNIFEEQEIDVSLFDDIEVIEEFKNIIKDIPDKRHPSYIKHNLCDIIMITFLGVLSNSNEWMEIEEFGIAKEEWLRRFLKLPNGIPSDDTFRIVISSLDSNYLYSLILEFLVDKLNTILKTFDVEDNERDILAFDGKTSCGSKRNATDVEKKKALHTLNVYSSNNGMCMGQVFIDEKSNEIPAMIDLLNITDVKGCILTWDALNTQKSTVEKVIAKKGDYVGALKGNQQTFYEDVKDYFDEDTLKNLKQSKDCYKIDKEKSHSSFITREYYMTTDIKWLYQKDDWKGLKSIGVEVKTIEKSNGKIVIEKRYFISSLKEINNFSRAIREHWGVENGLHWHLDFTFKDDKNTTLAKTGAKNLQIFKKIALALLKIVKPLYNCSLKLIRFKLALSFEKHIETIFKMLNTKELENLRNNI